MGQALTERTVPRRFTHVQLAEDNRWVRVVPDGRDGSTVFVRRLPRSEPDPGAVARVLPDQETVVLTERIPFIGFHTASELGRTDTFLGGVRLVPAGRDGCTVYARTLRPGELDSGAAPQLCPGDRLVIRSGDLVLAFDDLTQASVTAFPDGYRTITQPLGAWMAIVGPVWPAGMRYLLAAARRLDASHQLLRMVRQGLAQVRDPDLGAIVRRQVAFDVIGLAEMTVVAMHRALSMITTLSQHCNVTIPTPEVLQTTLPQLRELRNAYEHIEDRTRGVIRGKPNPDALSGSDFTRLLTEGIVSSRGRTLDLDTEATALLVAARAYLVEVVGGQARQLNQEIEHFRYTGSSIIAYAERRITEGERTGAGTC